MKTENELYPEYRYWFCWLRTQDGKIYVLTVDGGEALEVQRITDGWLDCDTVNRYDPAILKL